MEICNRTVAEYVYNEPDRISQVWYTENGGTETKAYTYEYDANGNLYRLTDTPNLRTYVYLYNPQGKLVQAVEYSGANESSRNEFSKSLIYNITPLSLFLERVGIF